MTSPKKKVIMKNSFALKSSNRSIQFDCHCNLLSWFEFGAKFSKSQPRSNVNKNNSSKQYKTASCDTSTSVHFFLSNHNEFFYERLSTTLFNRLMISLWNVSNGACDRAVKVNNGGWYEVRVQFTPSYMSFQEFYRQITRLLTKFPVKS